MSTETSLQHTTTASNDHADRAVRPDSECRALAGEFLTELIGSTPTDLRWDDTHRLQGHSHVLGRELVVIAPRDDRHPTVVLTAEDWDAVRRSSCDQRRALLDACVIADRNRLVAMLSECRPAAHTLLAAA